MAISTGVPPIAFVTAIATFAAVQEGHYIRTRKVTKCA
jgi:hypothetical protein